MTSSIPRTAIVWASIFVGLLILSLLFFLFRNPKQDHRVLFFPSESTGALTGELRLIHRQSSKEDSVQHVIQEIVLGPMEVELSRVLPRSTQVTAVMLRDRELYIDLSDEVLFPATDVHLTLNGMIAAIRKTIHYNFPRIGKVLVFVGGSLPTSETARPKPST